MSGGLETYDQHYPKGLRVGEDSVQDSQGRLGHITGKGRCKGIMTSREQDGSLVLGPVVNVAEEADHIVPGAARRIFSVISMRHDEQPAT